MVELSFKTQAYKVYAPWLYKWTRWRAKHLYSQDTANINEVTAMLWDRYLAKKFLAEAGRVGAAAVANIPWSKQSDILFILGCGSSINKITPEEWDLVAQYDSIGVNYFYFHDFKPTAHFIELGKSEAACAAVHKYLLNNPIRTEPVFMQIRHLVNNGIQLTSPGNRVKLYSPTTMKSRDLSVLRRYLAAYYVPRFNSSPLIHHSSTLDCIINFAVRQGYKKLCLLGVDLNNSAYFWDADPTKAQNNMAIAAVNADYQAANWQRDAAIQHATVDKQLTEKLNCLDLMDYLSLLKDTELKHRHIELVVANPQSLLTELFAYQSIADAAGVNK